jgi:hypothetical protein
MSARSDSEEQAYMVLYFIFLLAQIFRSWPDKGLLILKHVVSYYITNIQLRFRCFREYLWLYRNNGTPSIKLIDYLES